MNECKKFISISLLFLSAIVFAQDTDAVDSTNVIFEKIEVEASYPGGTQAWRKYLERNLKAEVPTDNGAPEGKYSVVVRFIVKKDGSISDVKAITKMGYGTEQEVVRLIKASGKWNPGSQGGRFVNSYHMQPVTFMVDDDGLEIRTETEYVLYANKDNQLTIDAHKIKPGNIKSLISRGTITATGDGQFIARVPKAGERVTISVYRAGNEDKLIGAVIFDVKAKE